MSFRILLVEDDEQLAEQLAGQLNRFNHDVMVTHEGQAALEHVARQTFDIIILDRMLPVVNGIEVLRELRSGGMRIPIIMLTALGQTYDKVEGLDAGADDYVVKPIDPIELNARLNALIRARRANGEMTDTISAGNIVISPSRFRAWRAGHVLDLARTEFRLLLMLVQNAGSVVTRKMLTEHIWGHDLAPSDNLLTAHMRRLRAKLIQHGDDPIDTMRGIGYSIGE